ncbi:MAG: RsmE family RNA methyltransferase [Gaiellales bacterium]
MTRHVHRVFVDETGELDELVELAADDRRHLERVLRMRAGARLEVVDGVGTVFAAELEEHGRARLRSIVVLRDDRPAPAVWLGSGGGRSDVAVEKLTELGVREIGALVCERTRGDFRLDRWARVASSAGRQAKRVDVPALAGPATFAEIVGRAGAIVLDHEADDAVPFAAAADALLLIGPEAGLSDAERELARAAGAPLARLGDGLVLRSETAAIVAAAVAAFGPAPLTHEGD